MHHSNPALFWHCFKQPFILLVFAVMPFYGMGQSTFLFRFTDAVTGIRVLPGRVIISPRKESKIKEVLSTKDIASNGTASRNVTDGAYDIVVYADGYKTISTWFEVRAQELKVNIRLDPEQPVKELTSDNIGALRTKNTVVITGFVTDETSGLPLGGVTVSSEDRAATTQTDSNGYYVLQLPLAHTENEIEGRGTLVFSKNGYTKELRQRFDMWPLGDLILPIKMNAGAGENRMNVIEKREVHREIIKQ